MSLPPLRWLVACLVLTGCPQKDAAPSKPEHAAAPVDAGPPTTLTFVVTGAENGYLLATAGADAPHGGAAEVAGRWAAEGLCVAPSKDDGSAGCPDSGTVALSTGDNANGASISSYFRGESTAEVMRQMGYVASAFGNRELDWSREQFVANTRRGGFPYLAANLEATTDDARAVGLQSFRVVERRGVKVGVVGLAARKATLTPMPGRMAGFSLVADEVALGKAVAGARAAGAQVVGVVTDGCLHEVPEVLSAHPDWALAFVAGRDCEAPWPPMVGSTALVYPGRHFNAYARVTVTVTGGKQTAVTAALVDVASPAGSPAPDAAVKTVIDGWKKKHDDALGEKIGFTRSGLEQEGGLMSTWLTGALKERFKTDVALLNRKTVRQALPAGPVTKASIWDLVPFENEVVLIKVTGAQLKAALGNVEARAAGVKSKDDQVFDARGAAIDDAKTYTVATSDYLYLGGDGFKLREADPSPTQTRVSVQAAIIEWTAGKKSDEKKPLEAQLK
jgi:2',3'-cyclic-nucleotide 2'-phosphodiesterase (5'-nucleotidase family)